MQKRYSFTSFFVVACVVIMIMSCKSRSYSSSPSLPQSESDSQLVIEDEDCFAWRFYLFTSMHSIVRQGALWIVDDIKKRYLHDIHSARKTMYLDMNKILPPETAQKIIDTIIEKEGGHCSREVLYEITPCAYEYVDPEGYRRGGGIVDADGAYTKINFSHFSESLGVPMNKNLLSEYKSFLGKHLSKSINTKYLTPRISCVDECHEDVFLLAHKNSLGRCMLEKHRNYFKENGMFDFDGYFKWKGYDHQPELHRSRMEDYIKETNRVAEEYKKNNP